MSGSLGDLTVRFTGDASNLTATISEVQGALSGIQSGSAGAARGLDSFTRNTRTAGNTIEKAGKQITEVGKSVDTVTKPVQVAAAALAAGGVAAGKFAIDFENNFARVEKTVEGTPEQLAAVKQGIIDLTTTGIGGRSAIPATTAELTELAAAGGQLGIKTENLLEFTEAMSQLGTATNLRGEEGAQTLAKYMNIMGVDQSNVRNLGSAIVDLGNNYATTEADIASMALRLGRTSAIVGISAQDTLAYATALSSLGIEAEAGGSAVSRTWTKLQNAASQGGESLEAFASISGMTADEFKQEWDSDPGSAFNAFIKGLSESEDIIADLAKVGINDIREGDAMKALANGYDIMTSALERSNTAWTENTALQNEADKMAETTAGQIQITKNNLVEAARGIGETMLPTIKDVSTGVKDFAQNLASMDEDSKKRLVNVGASIVAIGATAKGLSSATIGIGNIVEAVGKIKGTETWSHIAKGLAAIPAPAKVAAAGIAAVAGAALVGKAAYNEWYNSNYKFADGLKEANEATAQSIDELKNINQIRQQVSDLQLIINSPESSQAEIDSAKEKLEEIKALLAEEYNLIIRSDNSDLDDKLDKLSQKSRFEAQTDALNARDSFNDAFNTYTKNEEKYADDIEKYDKAYEKVLEKQERLDELQRMEENYGPSNYIAEQRMLTRQSLDKAIGDLNKYAERIKDVDEALKTMSGEAESAANNQLELLNFDAMEGDAKSVQRDLKAIGDIIAKANSVGADLDADGYAQAASLAMNNVATLEDAWSQGGATLDNVVKDYITASKAFGASAEQTSVGAALIKNGFRDISSAASAGALDTVSQQATEFAHSMGELENKSIKITAEGDMQIIDDMTQRVEEIQGEDVTVKVNAEGNLETITEAGNEVTQLDGKVASVRVNAEGNYEAVDEVGNTLAVIDGKTGTINIVAGDTSGLEAAEEADELNSDDVSITITADGDTTQIEEVQNAINAINGQQCTIQINPRGNYDVLDAAKNRIAEINGQTAEVTVNATDSATPIVIGVATSLASLPPSADTQINAHDNASGTISSVASQLSSLNGRSATVTVNIQTNGSIPNIAKGDTDFAGGLAMINDQKGVSDPRELVTFGGKSYLFEGRDVIVPLPKHARIYTASQTKEILSEQGIPRYASGKNNEDWENAKADRTHIRNTSYRIIPAWEELYWLDEMKRKFSSDAEVIKEIEEEIVTYTKKMWEEALEAEQFSLDMGWQSQEEYYSHLAAYRDENFAPDTQEWRDATLELHKYSQQLIEDANDVSRAYADLHGRLNDWAEMGTTMGAVWQTVNLRNVQAAKDGLITWEDYFETREELTEQYINNYLDYSDDWVKHEQDYNAMGADGTIAAINRQRAEVENYFAEIGELTDEEYALKIKILAELDDKAMDAALSKVNEWRDDADWYKKQADVYGWDFLHDDNELDYWQRVIDGEMAASQNSDLSETARREALRNADEARLELYKATESHYDELLDLAKEKMDDVEKLLDDKISALEESWEVEDRAEDKAETVADMEKFRYAVTIEGQEKYKEAAEHLKEIERDEEIYALEQEHNALMEQLQAEYEALEAEKANILEQVRIANQSVANILEPLESQITSNMDTLASRIETAIDKIQPNVTINNTNYINDGTDGIMYSNRIVNQLLTYSGG